MFSERDNPQSTRLSYALATREDQHLTSMIEVVKEQIPGAATNCLIFDGCEIMVPDGKGEGDLRAVLDTINEQSPVEWVLKVRDAN